jgi:aspartyl-tRNA(Asn)/glutamyl-tRNA(Gln) amidotransferase subunit B
VVIDRAWLDGIAGELPELPAARHARFESEYALSRYDVELLVEDRAVADYFEQIVQQQKPEVRSPKAAANWVTGELFRLMNETGQDMAQARTHITPEALASLTTYIAGGMININTAKTVFEEMFRTGRGPQAIIAERGLAQISDAEEIEKLVADVITSHPDQLATYLGGKATVEQWFFGQVMKRLQGQGNPHVIRETLKAALEKARLVARA